MTDTNENQQLPSEAWLMCQIALLQEIAMGGTSLERQRVSCEMLGLDYWCLQSFHERGRAIREALATKLAAAEELLRRVQSHA